MITQKNLIKKLKLLADVMRIKTMTQFNHRLINHSITPETIDVWISDVDRIATNDDGIIIYSQSEAWNVCWFKRMTVANDIWKQCHAIKAEIEIAAKEVNDIVYMKNSMLSTFKIPKRFLS